MAKMSTRGPTKRFLISEMDRSVKRMLKLIEDEGDSFAKKAEIYIQKRPVLVSQVEDFYRMFRSLAERYENATCELTRTLPSDIRSRTSDSSGMPMTDIVSEPPSTITSPEHKLNRRLSGVPTGYFDVGNNGYENGSDSDDTLFNNHSSSSNYGNYRRLRRKIAELEGELKKVQMEQEVNKTNPEIEVYEEELRIAKEKIQASEEEINVLRTKLERYESMEPRDDDFSDESVDRIYALEEKLGGAEEDVRRLRREFDSNETLHQRFGSNDEKRIEETEMEDELEELKMEREEFVAKVSELEEEMRLKDDQIDEMNDRLQKLQMECEQSRKSIEELTCRGRDMEKVIEKQREVIEEGVEEKRQAVRQLSISLEHYRNAYQMLRQNLLEHKTPVMAS
ncbi:uncharacterized protein [Rutidosis leptorrhynchoides]|uniref:uncharacterized protein n=1 Tax=Rutidosis leptorrhynchoides TaxID=125765 RepID=UPI003A9A54E9